MFKSHKRKVQGAIAGLAEEFHLSKYAVRDLNEFATKVSDIIIIIDDSSSMNAPIGNGTRWTHALQDVCQVMRLGCVFDRNGVDVLFLNRPGKKKVKDISILSDAFSEGPRGRTPLTEKLTEALKTCSKRKNTLIVIATDGEPTDQGGIQAFANTLSSKNDNVYISMLACSDKDEEVGYLRQLDESVNHLNVQQPYPAEAERVAQVQGPEFPYSPGDHIVRLLLGPVFPQWDELNEKVFY